MVETSAGPELLGPADVRRLAAELGFRPTKQRGQNFVTDPNTIRRIIRIADLEGSTEHESVLEIGAGLGSLTLGLLTTPARVVAVEVDARLAAALPATVRDRAPAQADRLDVVTADALRLDPSALPGPAPSALVANLPYNIAVPVLLRTLELFGSIGPGLVMVQLEVAERLTAAPGTRTYGVPSVKAAWYCSVASAGLVGRNVFWPQPNVDSGLVGFRRVAPPTTTATREQVFAVIDAAFSTRRKTLRAALAGVAGSPAAAERTLVAAGVDPALRGERLDIAEFAAIAEALAASGGLDFDRTVREGRS